MMRYSITIPAYKVYFFRECVESVLCQTYDDYEVVILNDCSPENVKEIVEECQKLKNGDKIRYYENEKNVCDKFCVRLAKQRGWKVFALDGTSWEEYAGSENGGSGMKGDMNNDNKVTIADAVLIVDEILNK